MLSTLLAEIVAERESNEVANFFYLKNTHREKLHSAQEFLKIKFLLLLIFSICLHNQSKFHGSIELKF